MTILDVAELSGLCWDTVKGIIKERLAKDYAHIRLKDLRRLAIDEIYLGRKKKYLTLVIDQETGIYFCLPALTPLPQKQKLLK